MTTTRTQAGQALDIYTHSASWHEEQHRCPGFRLGEGCTCSAGRAILAIEREALPTVEELAAAMWQAGIETGWDLTDAATAVLAALAKQREEGASHTCDTPGDTPDA